MTTGLIKMFGDGDICPSHNRKEFRLTSLLIKDHVLRVDGGIYFEEICNNENKCHDTKDILNIKLYIQATVIFS